MTSETRQPPRPGLVAGGADDRRHMRAVANNVILHLHPTKVAAGALRWRYTWGLGGISALLVTLLIMTGVLLMFKYEPTVSGAYASVRALETQVLFGSLVRGVHHWSANLLMITACLHLVRVFATGSYKRGRGWNWAVGLALLLLVVLFNFTGYLLPWDQLAYWAITVGTSLLGYVPLIGRGLSRAVLAGPEVGQGALTNFYALHVAVLPMALLALLTYHFWRIRKDGGLTQPDAAPGAARRVTTIPHLVARELAAAGVVVAAVVIGSMVVPAPLEEVANPLAPLNPAKAAWYFLGIQELLLHMHAPAALTLVFGVLIGLVALPRWDSGPDGVGVPFRSRIGRRAALIGALLALIGVPLLVVADEWWVDWAAWLPWLPLTFATGVIPLAVTVAGLLLIYGAVRGVLRATHGEALVGLFVFLGVSLVVLTVIGIVFRGENMVLMWPW